MGALFSKKNAKPVVNCEVTEHDQAILQLKTQRDKIKQFIRRKEKGLEKERELAKQLIKNGRKDRALLLLKKKRYQENVIEQTVQQLDKIDLMVQDLEFADVQQRVVEGLRQGNEALKKMNSLFNVDEIDKIMEDTKEAAEYQAEITSMISGQLSSTDMSEIEKELEELVDVDEVALPEVPTADLPELVDVKEKQKEKRREAVALEA